MTDVLRQLQRASWRGIEFPVMGTRDFGFVHDQENHKFIFRDSELIESLGRQNPTFRYSIPFREDIARNPWKNLFTQVYPKFLDACLDRSNGDLVDPVHGVVQCKCVSFRELLDVTKRDGTDVEVEFIRSPEVGEFESEAAENLSTIESATALQGALDRDATQLSDETRAALAEYNKGSEMGRVNPLDFATGVLNQVEAAGNKIDAAFGDVIFRAEKLDAALANARDPKTQPMRSNARRLELVARDLQSTAIRGEQSKSRSVGIYTVPQDIGKIALAGRLRNSVQDLIRLNPTIARSATVKQGTQIAYFRGG